MKQRIVAIGIVVLLVGLFLILGWSIQKETIKEYSDKVEDEWNITGDFSQGNNLSLYFVQYGDWSYPYYPETVMYAGMSFPAKILKVNITNVELNNYTLFEVTLVPPLKNVPIQEPYNFELQIFNIAVTHHGALTVKDEPDEVCGAIKNDGLYIVNCSLFPDTVIDKYLNGTLWHHSVHPPIELWLYKITVEIERPYTFFLPLGISVSVVGATVIVWWAKGKRRRIARKKV
jgi:hypothetical protein